MTVTKTFKNGREIYEVTDATPEEISQVMNSLLHEATEVYRESAEKPFTPSDDPAYYLSNLGNKWGMDAEEFIYTMSCINDTTPGALNNIILMEIAKEYDCKYPDHISEAPEFWYYSVADGKIHNGSQSEVSNKARYKYFAAFRSQEDALYALRLLNACKKCLDLE